MRRPETLAGGEWILALGERTSVEPDDSVVMMHTRVRAPCE
jgi:hypothetical protein